SLPWEAGASRWGPETEVQGQLVPMLIHVLNTDGILLVGASETIRNETARFAPVNEDWTIDHRTSALQLPALLLELPRGGTARRGTTNRVPRRAGILMDALENGQEHVPAIPGGQRSRS